VEEGDFFVEGHFLDDQVGALVGRQLGVGPGEVLGGLHSRELGGSERGQGTGSGQEAGAGAEWEIEHGDLPFAKGVADRPQSSEKTATEVQCVRTRRFDSTTMLGVVSKNAQG
jgi:hypothetical protein